LESLLISIGVVALAEIGDKTQLLAFLLAARFKKPFPIIGGILAATIVNHGLAGAVGAWITATARLPYVAGVDSYLPPSFGKLHPKFGTPYVAILTQATLSAVLIGVGQAGSTVGVCRGPADVVARAARADGLRPASAQRRQAPAVSGVVAIGARSGSGIGRRPLAARAVSRAREPIRNASAFIG